MLRRRLLVGGDEVGLRGVATGRAMRGISATGGVAPPRLEGISACVARCRTVGSALSGVGERGALGRGRERFLVGVASSED